MRAARAVAHGRERDLAPGAARVAAASQQRAAGSADGEQRHRGGDGHRGAQDERGAEPAAAALADRQTQQRRRRGGLPLLAPERAQLRRHVAQLARDVVVACHAPSASIISRSRVRPRTIRALTVPIGMPVAALISLWLSSS